MKLCGTARLSLNSCHFGLLLSWITKNLLSGVAMSLTSRGNMIDLNTQARLGLHLKGILTDFI